MLGTMPREQRERTKEEQEASEAQYQTWKKQKSVQLRREKRERKARDAAIRKDVEEANALVVARIRALKEKEKQRSVHRVRPLVKPPSKSSLIVARAQASPLGLPVITAAKSRRSRKEGKQQWAPTKAFAS